MPSHPRRNPKIPEGINSSQEHPIKEFAQLLVGVTLSIIIATALLTYAIGFAAPFIPYSWERKASTLFNADALPIEVDESTSDSHQQALEALEALGNEIITSMATLADNQSGADDDITSGDYQFHLIAETAPNAFATFGGHIIVTEGLLQQVSSENALAMVISHEIAHIQYRHPIQSASRGVILQLILLASGVSSGGIFGGTLDVASLYTLLSFNREMELDADKQALRILEHHYGHLEGADEFFTAMAEEGNVSWLEFTRTHPNTQRRLEVIQAAMKETETIGVSQLIPMEARFRP